MEDKVKDLLIRIQDGQVFHHLKNLPVFCFELALSIKSFLIELI